MPETKIDNASFVRPNYLSAQRTVASGDIIVEKLSIGESVDVSKKKKKQ